MAKKSQSISRIFRKYLTIVSQQIHFKTSHITQAGKITLLGCIVCFIALFFSWISPLNNIISCGYGDIPNISSFSGILGHVGIFILSIVLLISFSIFSIHKKEKLHFLSLIQLSDQTVSFYGSLSILILSLHSFLLINGLQFFSINISHGKGIALCFTGAIIILIGSKMMEKEQRKNPKGTYVSDIQGSSLTKLSDDSKDNMKLPF